MRTSLLLFLMCSTTGLDASRSVPALMQGQPSLSVIEHGAITRGDARYKNIALVFTGDEYFEGLKAITKTLRDNDVKAGFFLTGRLYENKKAQSLIKSLVKDGHYMGPHSDKHLLYNDWNKRDSLLVTRDSLVTDLKNNYNKMEALGINYDKKYFIPPYEWWNSTVTKWCKEEGSIMISCTRGIPTNADYTYPEMGKSYKSSESILAKLYEIESLSGLNGAIILVHVGTDPRRTDKFYNHLSEVIVKLKSKGYTFTRVDEMLDD